MQIEDHGEVKFPQEALERCYLRGNLLFWGIWKVLYKRNPNLTFGLHEALKKFGLAIGDNNFPCLHDLNPTDEILQKLTDFKDRATFPNLRGKRRRIEYCPLTALQDYSSTFYILKNMRKFYNRNLWLKKIKESWPEILENMNRVRRRSIPSDLEYWANLSKRQLTLRLVAHIHGLAPEAFRKYLTNARREHPDLARVWKNGAQIITVPK